MAKEEKRLRLLAAAEKLPPTSGVYIMYDASGCVIYVGKSKRLCSRVSQYFMDTGKNAKTEKMASSVDRFDYILCGSEIEALTLENVLIKKYKPRYNIRLKDAKSYPYIKVTVGDEYPRILMTRKREADGARYFGPYSGTATVYSVIETMERTLGLAACRHVFPRDIGRVRPCIYKQMKRCAAPCTGLVSSEEYKKLIDSALLLLGGATGEAKRALAARMNEYAEGEQFESAALCRDAISALDRLSVRQKAVIDPHAQFDAAALAAGDICSCVSLIEVRDGAITGKDDFLFTDGEVADAEGALAFLAELYGERGYIPPEVLVSEGDDAGGLSTLSEYLSEKAGRRISVRVPQRGDRSAVCRIAAENAAQKIKEYSEKAKSGDEVLVSLAQTLALEVVPERIEAYDISNIGSEKMRAGMVTALRGSFEKKDYRLFSIQSGRIDDYAAMREAVERRLAHDGDGAFPPLPDLILLDGGRGHVSAVRSLLREKGIDIPVFGMVKDEYHKTRAIADEHGEVSIARSGKLFVFVYKLQEEVHRYTVSSMMRAKRKTLRHSSLTEIRGIGDAKAKLLLAHFGSIASVAKADAEELMLIKGINRTDAENISAYFRKPEGNNKK